jgi:hypothetical protein
MGRGNSLSVSSEKKEILFFKNLIFEISRRGSTSLGWLMVTRTFPLGSFFE